MKRPQGIGNDSSRLLGAAPFAEDQARLEVVEVERAELLDGDRLMIELAFLGGVVTTGHTTQLHLRFLPGSLRRPDAMEADCEAAGSTSCAILDKIASLARRENAEAKARQLVVPDEVVLLANLGSIHDTFVSFATR